MTSRKAVITAPSASRPVAETVAPTSTALSWTPSTPATTTPTRATASAVISKRHCAVLVKEAQVFVRDFGSTNGTFVNDVPVKGEASLKNEDILKIGPLEFKVSLEVKREEPRLGRHR